MNNVQAYDPYLSFPYMAPYQYMWSDLYVIKIDKIRLKYEKNQ